MLSHLFVLFSWVLSIINFPLRAAFNMCQRLYGLCFHFHFNPEIFFISLVISSLTHSSFTNELLNLCDSMQLLKVLWPLTFSFIAFCSGKIHRVISCFYLLKFVLYFYMLSVLEKCPQAVEQKAFSLVFRCNSLQFPVRSTSCLVSFYYVISLFMFCPNGPSIGESGTEIT